MLINKSCQALIATSIILGAFVMPLNATAKGWQQILQQGASVIRRGVEYHRGESGYSSEGAYSRQAPSQPPVDHSAQAKVRGRTTTT